MVWQQTDGRQAPCYEVAMVHNECPIPGFRVVTMDGVPLGRVTEVRSDRFQVENDVSPAGEPPLRRWLRLDAVYTCSDRRITLVCNAGRIEHYAWEPRSIHDLTG